MADIAALYEFNGTVKKLVRFAASKSKKLTIGGAVKRTRLLLEEAPLSAMETLGPLLDKYRDKVVASDEKYFMETDLSKEIPEEHAAEKKDIVELIEKLKKIYRKCKPADKQTVLGDMKQLLVSYDSYNSVTR
jgi:hypothetical protein